MKKRCCNNHNIVMSGMPACLKPHPLGCARIPGHKKIHWIFLIIPVLVLILLISSIFIVGRSYFTGFSTMNRIFNPIFILTSVGRLFISINFDINIDSPRNITYNYSLNSSYPIPLNVSSIRNITSWNYTLIDMKHNVILNNSVTFIPNTTIYAKRWSNRLVVNATDYAGNMKGETVDFFIFVNNSAPLIQNISSNIYACEGSYLNYTFNVSDIDEDTIIPSLSPQYPNNPFYIMYISNYNYSVSIHEIYSGNLTKADAGGANARGKNYSGTVYASDGQYIDSAMINITVIETNNAPGIQAINNTIVWTSGDNSSFYYQVRVNDTEDGNQSSGNISFNISFSRVSLFNISSNGVMSFSPNSSQIGAYNITICVIDSGLRNPHANISLCGQNGSNLSSCMQFILTVSERTVEISPVSGGGGGIGGGIACLEKWGCGEWSECNKLYNDKSGKLSLNLTEALKKNCSLVNWNSSICGYQTRKCNELNNCKTNKSMPGLVQICSYSEKPSCNDSIKNCHDDSCEILVDCGGPCQACPTCSDKIKNQGEEDIDCGGPCPACAIEVPFYIKKTLVYTFLLFSILLIIIIIILIISYNIRKRRLRELRVG